MAAREDDSCDRAGYFIHSIDKSDLRPGDHIYCHRKLYNHHGIYIGERDCEVIHFSGPENNGLLYKKMGTLYEIMEKVGKYLLEDSRSEDSKRKMQPICIRSTNLYTFLNGAPARLVSYNSSGIKKLLVIVRSSCHTMEAMPPSETVKLAKHFLEHPSEWGNYNLASNNCETFACFCKTGLMDIAAQLHPTRNVVKEAFHTPCQTYERAIRDYRALQ